MPAGITGGVLLILVAVSAGLYATEKITHAKPIVKFNHEVCHVVTLGHKCKPTHPQPKPSAGEPK